MQAAMLCMQALTLSLVLWVVFLRNGERRAPAQTTRHRGSVTHLQPPPAAADRAPNRSTRARASRRAAPLQGARRLSPCTTRARRRSAC